MKTLCTALVLVLLGVPAGAEDLLNAEDFQSLAEGYTLYFDQAGRPYGAEQYLEDRQVIWQYADGTCTRGTWSGGEDTICFTYEDSPGTQCWHFAARGRGFFARVAGLEAGAPSELALSGRSRSPLRCIAPDLGV
ncbi:hypothetical protein [Oceanibium sediminis]|uniref:hypothetical protein n=1 Tax=Oceanibium sediminis TaxID=2026339 RepID=UPI000DD4980F|nr:hypothetical protein [Oceanibium sediminis]